MVRVEGGVGILRAMDAVQTARLVRFLALVVMGALWACVHLDITLRVLRSQLMPRYVRVWALVPVVAPLLIGRAGYPRMARSWLAAGVTYAVLWLVPSIFLR
jgi:hypothetical protein